MKKILFAILTSVIFVACSNDDDSSHIDGDQNKLIFDISAVSSLNNLKAGQPIHSQEASHNITNVNVIAFKEVSGVYVYEKTFTISGWSLSNTSQQHIVDNADMLSAGNYSFIALGRSSNDNYTLTTLTAGTTKYEDYVASVQNSGDEYELFAGTGEATIVAGGGARVRLDMTRKVGGLLGYFTNIPEYYEGTKVRYLRLSISAANKEVVISSGLGKQAADNGYNIIDIDLSLQNVLNGVYTGNDLSSAGVVKLGNSQLGGAYLIPVNNVRFTLGLYDANEQPVKEWTVLNGTDTSFNILPNNFYSIGTKAKANSTDGGTPEDESDDDKASDLLTNQEIEITISDDWETLHDLTIQ